MIHNFNKYLNVMHQMGYTNSFDVLDARDFGLPQARKRLFVVSILGNETFDFSTLIKKPMESIEVFLEKDETVGEKYTIVSPSMLGKIDENNCKTATMKNLAIIDKFAFTITCKQDRAPNSGIIKRKNGKFRLLTERECWRLQGFTDEDFENALKSNVGIPNKKNTALYKQAGNSMPVNVLEAIFRSLILGEIETKGEEQLKLEL